VYLLLLVLLLLVVTVVAVDTSIGSMLPMRLSDQGWMPVQRVWSASVVVPVVVRCAVAVAAAVVVDNCDIVPDCVGRQAVLQMDIPVDFALAALASLAVPY